MISSVGRKYEGLRPRRITIWIGEKGWEFNPVPSVDDFMLFRDRWGVKLLLHPYYQIDRHIIAFGSYDIGMHRYIEKRVSTGMICADVGANIGSVSLHLAVKVTPNGRVYSFEPVPRLYRILCLNVKENGLHEIVNTNRVALSNFSGVVSMRIPEACEANHGMGSLIDRVNSKLSKEIDVLSMTFDEFVERERIRKLDFMKVDIEGAEILFLEGARKSVTRLMPELLIEVSPNALAASGGAEKLIYQIRVMGYEIFRLDENGTLAKLMVDEHEPFGVHAYNVICRKC